MPFSVRPVYQAPCRRSEQTDFMGRGLGGSAVSRNASSMLALCSQDRGGPSGALPIVVQCRQARRSATPPAICLNAKSLRLDHPLFRPVRPN